MGWFSKPGRHRRTGAHDKQDRQPDLSPQVDTEIVQAKIAVATSQRLQEAAHERRREVLAVAESITFLGQRRPDIQTF